jgi:hypothetical protein
MLYYWGVNVAERTQEQPRTFWSIVGAIGEPRILSQFWKNEREL